MKTGSGMTLAAALALALALLLTNGMAAPAQAAGAHAGQKAAKPQKKPVRVTYGRDSGETVSERERRLYRECRGRPNAGACEGYAR